MYNGFKFINVVFVSLCLSQFKNNLIIFHDTAWIRYVQVQHHVTLKTGKFNIKPEAVLFRVEFHSRLPSSGYGRIIKQFKRIKKLWGQDTAVW